MVCVSYWLVCFMIPVFGSFVHACLCITQSIDPIPSSWFDWIFPRQATARRPGKRSGTNTKRIRKTEKRGLSFPSYLRCMSWWVVPEFIPIENQPFPWILIGQERRIKAWTWKGGKPLLVPLSMDLESQFHFLLLRLLLSCLQMKASNSSLDMNLKGLQNEVRSFAVESLVHTRHVQRHFDHHWSPSLVIHTQPVVLFWSWMTRVMWLLWRKKNSQPCTFAVSPQTRPLSTLSFPPSLPPEMSFPQTIRRATSQPLKDDIAALTDEKASHWTVLDLAWSSFDFRIDLVTMIESVSPHLIPNPTEKATSYS